MLKFIIWVLAFFLIFRFLTRLFLPIVVRKVVNNMASQQQASNQRPAGSVRVETNKDKTGYNQSNRGEYVDFEEIK